MTRWRKILLRLLAVLSLCASLAPPVLAAESYVYDEAGLLSSSERGTLESRAAEVSEEYGCAVCIVTVWDYREYGAGDVYAAAESIFEEYGLGLGAEDSGVLLLLSMEDRDYALIFHGYGDRVFAEYDRDRLEDAFLDDFRRDDWYQGFVDYISYSAALLEPARGGEPSGVIEAYSPSVSRGLRGRLGVFGSIVVIAVLPALIALIVCTIAKRNMKNVKKAEKADFFAAPGSMKLYASEDRFTHITQTRVKVESDSDHEHNRGGGGGGGFSGRSGKF